MFCSKRCKLGRTGGVVGADTSGRRRASRDEERCAHLGTHRHNARLGCRVQPDALAAWSSDISKRWKRIHNGARNACKREMGRCLPLATRAWEPQARGPGHVHPVFHVYAHRQASPCGTFAVAGTSGRCGWGSYLPRGGRGSSWDRSSRFQARGRFAGHDGTRPGGSPARVTSGRVRHRESRRTGAQRRHARKRVLETRRTRSFMLTPTSTGMTGMPQPTASFARSSVKRRSRARRFARASSGSLAFELCRTSSLDCRTPPVGTRELEGARSPGCFHSGAERRASAAG